MQTRQSFTLSSDDSDATLEGSRSSPQHEHFTRRSYVRDATGSVARRCPRLVVSMRASICQMVDRSRRFTTVVTTGPKKRVLVPVPFDPNDEWGVKTEHHVAGTVNGMGVRAVVEPMDEGLAIVLGPAWRRDCGIGPGDEVDVMLEPEGPLREDLPSDIAGALEAEPAAGAFFDSIAQAYRRAYLDWIDATKRRPEVRAERIAATVGYLKAGIKSRPDS
jgi:hypothetical protein